MSVALIQEGSPQVFRAAAPWRGFGVYVILGYIIIGAACLGLQQAGLAGGGWGGLVRSGVFFGFLYLSVPIIILRFRIRIDDEGIWQRLFWRWQLWSWDAFAGGLIRRGPGPGDFIDSSKSWWNRRLLLLILEKADSDHVLESIHRYWRLPPLPELPPEIITQFGLGKRIELFSAGLRIKEDKPPREREYAWAEVQEVQITRQSHLHRNFEVLEIALPGQKIRIGKRPDWCDAETLVRFIQKDVPADRVKIYAKFGPPQSVEEANFRLQKLEMEERQDRWLRIITWVLPILFALLPLKRILSPQWNVIRGDPWFWFEVGLVWLFAFLLAVAVWMGRSSARKYFQQRREEVQNWRPPTRKQDQSPA